MTTDSGGWTIVYASNGGDSNVGMTSNSEKSGDPLAFAHHNLNRARKMALSALSTQSLFVRSTGPWLRATHALFDQNLSGNSHQHFAATLTSNSGASAAGWLGYATYNISGGGDYNVSMQSGNSCSNTMVNGVDHHSSSYYHLNCGCEKMYLYCYSGQVKDGDAGYDVNTGLGSWSVTSGCKSDEAGHMKFYAAMR
jgi:hypothetical protein